MLGNHILLALSWILYGVLHSVLAGLSVKNFFRKKLGDKYKHYRLAYTLVAFISLVLVVWFQFSIQSTNIFTPDLFTQSIGGITSVCGLMLMLICIKKYFIGLSGLRSLLHEEVYTKLIISGVHRYVRHPLYLGTFLFLWGLLVVFPLASLLVSNTVITVYTLIGIKLEEKKLLLDFGEPYSIYQTKVPKLFPKFYTGEKPLHSHRQKQRIER